VEIDLEKLEVIHNAEKYRFETWIETGSQNWITG